MKSSLSVALVDDDVRFANALRLLLKSAGWKLTHFRSGTAFLEDTAEADSEFDCLLVDFLMPGMTGLELVETLSKQRFSTPILLLSAHVNVAQAVKAIKHGVYDVIEKPFDDEHLLDCIREAVNKSTKCEDWLRERKIAVKKITLLSRREREVFDLMASGRRNSEIAEDLGISPKTLDIHRANVMDKLNARTVADLVRAHFLEKMQPQGFSYITS